MRIYYDELAKNIVLGSSNRLFATGSLEASEFRGRVSVVYKDNNQRELFIRHDRILRENGQPAGQTLAEVVAYLNAEFVKTPFVGGGGGGGAQVPFLITSNETFTVQENKQAVFVRRIKIQDGGRIVLGGILIEGR